MRFGFAALFAIFAASPLCADGWFPHPFGELRSYHGDWLAVCDDLGAGPCRLVHLSDDPAVRVAILVDQDAVEVTLNDAPFEVTSVALALDGAPFALPDFAWSVGGFGVPNLVQSVVITQQPTVGKLIAVLKAENNIRIDISGVSARVPLRGVTAGLNAITERRTTQ